MNPGDAVTRKLVTFGRILREAGMEVGPGRAQDALRGLDLVDLADREQVYHALRCTLVSRHDHLPLFDAAFQAFWEGSPRAAEGLSPPGAVLPPTSAAQGSEPEDGVGDEPDEDDELFGISAADHEVLRHRDFAQMSADELRRVRRLMDELAELHPVRRSRRLEPAHSGGVLDQRRTLRQAMRSDGIPLDRQWRRPKWVPRKLVVLVDVSGSMEPYARALIMFLQALSAREGAARYVEAFAFGTRLTRLTPHLAGRDPDVALARASMALSDWGGGTRIGESLAAYNRVYGRRGLTRGAVVVIASDGWERGDLSVLDRQLDTISRQADTLMWVNPLKGHEGFEPLAGGMQIALRHVDDFLEGHNLAALEALGIALRRLHPGRRGSIAPPAVAR
ncbi:MAG TPA: VWA domain-containing protein [Gaiellales bacterium]|nr:VWA domain-containing protein [Gaiellales bacterium]